jgi:hypothetical protein
MMILTIERGEGAVSLLPNIVAYWDSMQITVGFWFLFWVVQAKFSRKAAAEPDPRTAWVEEE